MYLTPIIRTNRAIAACLIYPSHPIQAIAISEIASFFIPIFNPKLYSRIFAITLMLMYQPNYAYYYIIKYREINKIHNEAEICSLLLFILIMGFEYIK